jgi:hypothetical protein
MINFPEVLIGAARNFSSTINACINLRADPPHSGVGEVAAY